MTLAQIMVLGLALFTAAVAVVDFRTGHIPNRLIVAGLVGFACLVLSMHIALRPPEQTFAAALGRSFGNVLVGAVVCGVVPLVLFRVGAMGGGDVKLLAVVGAALGPLRGLELELTAFVVMALYAPARLAYEGKLLRMLGNSAALIINPFLPKPKRRSVPPALMTSLPFGPAVFVATVLCALGAWWRP